MVGNRHSARLRGAISGKDKTDVVDAEVLSRAADVFTLRRLVPPSPDQLALRRACRRRHKVLVDHNRVYRRLLSLARWAFPDVWIAFAGSRATAVAVLTGWPHLEALSRAQLPTVTDVVAAHTRRVGDVGRRAAAIRDAARGFAASLAVPEAVRRRILDEQVQTFGGSVGGAGGVVGEDLGAPPLEGAAESLDLLDFVLEAPGDGLVEEDSGVGGSSVR